MIGLYSEDEIIEGALKSVETLFQIKTKNLSIEDQQSVKAHFREIKANLKIQIRNMNVEDSIQRLLSLSSKLSVTDQTHEILIQAFRNYLSLSYWLKYCLWSEFLKLSSRYYNKKLGLWTGQGIQRLFLEYDTGQKGELIKHHIFVIRKLLSFIGEQSLKDPVESIYVYYMFKDRNALTVDTVFFRTENETFPCSEKVKCLFIDLKERTVVGE